MVDENTASIEAAIPSMHLTGGYMLNREQIIQAVASGEIVIQYHSLPTKEGGVQKNSAGLKVQALSSGASQDPLQKDIWDFFENALEQDSLVLTVGPYAMIEYGSFWRWAFDHVARPPFGRDIEQRGQQHIFNFLKSRELQIYPGENILIGTNEVIKLSANIGASLFAAVRNTDVGLPHISTTIDPSWNGKLQIGIVNPTRIAKELNLYEPICKVRFHRFGEPCGDPGKAKKIHANDWWSLEKDPKSELFPRRKQSDASKNLRKALFTQAVRGVGVFALLGALAWGIWRASSSINAVTSGAEKIATYEKSVDESKEKLRKLEVRAEQLEANINSGSSLIHDTYKIKSLRAGQSFSVGLGGRYNKRPFAFVEIDGVPPKSISSLVDFPEKGRGKDSYFDSATVTLSPLRPKELAGKEIVVHTMVVVEGFANRDAIRK